MTKRSPRWLRAMGVGVGVVSMLTLAACDNNDGIEDTAEEIGDSVEDAVDDVQDTADDVVDEINDG